IQKCDQPGPSTSPESHSVCRAPSPLSWSRSRVQPLSVVEKRSDRQNQPPTSKPMPWIHLLFTWENGSTSRWKEKLPPESLLLLRPSSPSTMVPIPIWNSRILPGMPIASSDRSFQFTFIPWPLRPVLKPLLRDSRSYSIWLPVLLEPWRYELMAPSASIPKLNVGSQGVICSRWIYTPARWRIEPTPVAVAFLPLPVPKPSASMP